MLIFIFIFFIYIFFAFILCRRRNTLVKKYCILICLVKISKVYRLSCKIHIFARTKSLKFTRTEIVPKFMW